MKRCRRGRRSYGLRLPPRPEFQIIVQIGLVQLVQSWIDEGDADEQRETLEYLIQALDEDRLSDRKLFPKELKGKSW